jgi:site-specific recombinase XerD
MGRRRRVPGTIERRGDTHRVRLRIGGKRYVYTVKTTDRRVADEFAIKKDRELRGQAERRTAGLVTGMCLSALLKEYETNVMPALAEGTQAAYKDSLKLLRRYFVEPGEEEVFKDGDALPAHRQDPAIDTVRAAHVQAYMTWRRTHRLDGETMATHNRTIQKDRAVLHRIFNYADRLEYREGNPVGRVQSPKPDERDPVILTDAQFEKLIEECADRPMLALYVLVLGETGGRCKSEVMWLQWDDVHLDDGFLRIVTGRNGHRTKGGKSRWVPMTPRLVAAFKQHFARYRFAAYDGKGTPWVFHHELSRARHVAGARIRSLHRSFASAARRAELPAGLHQHDLRHRRVTTWLADGADVTKVKEAVGHSDIRTTMRYTHLAKEHLRSLVDSPRTAKNKAG